MILNLGIFYNQNTIINYYSSQEHDKISINGFLDIEGKARKNIEWEFTSSCKIALKLISDYDYFIMKNFHGYVDYDLIILCSNSFSSSGLITLNESNDYHLLFYTDESGIVEYNIKFDSEYFDFLILFYVILIFCLIIDAIIVGYKLYSHPKENLKKNNYNSSDNTIQTEEHTKYCPYCGIEVDLDSIYCHECGNKL